MILRYYSQRGRDIDRHKGRFGFISIKNMLDVSAPHSPTRNSGLYGAVTLDVALNTEEPSSVTLKFLYNFFSQ